MGWKEFADALDRFKGTGLGAFQLCQTVDRKIGRGIKCRYCALGAAYKADAGRLGTLKERPSLVEVGERLGVPYHEIYTANDRFGDGNEDSFTRQRRLKYMRVYARSRANGLNEYDASAAAYEALRTSE